jgi:uncharacterized protein with FMN-binding domain
MPHKLPRRLVALSSSAIAAVYFAGLVNTRGAAITLAEPVEDTTPTSTAASTLAPSSPTATAIVVGATAAPTSTAPASASAFRAGTYTGTGTSRFGNVSVSVAISNGQISNVSITKVTTSFPVSRIASLPGAVVKNQTASVNVISGATYSSNAFKQAVQQALAQAQAQA